MLLIGNRQRLWQYFNQHRVMSVIVGYVLVMIVFGLVWLSTAFGPSLFGALAQTPCVAGDQTYMIQNGDTLGSIAASHGTTWQGLNAYNHLANPNQIFVGQHICISGKGNTGIVAGVSGGNQPVSVMAPDAVHGSANPFPRGQCTWWASQRFFELHGFFVPWTINSNAFQWRDRAQEFRWIVSNQPSVGAIVNLQPNVQGASSLGHVAVVETVMDNGHVLASNLNWGPNFSQVTNVEFTPGPGVSFITA